MSDRQALIKEGPNEILQRIQAKNEKLLLIDIFARHLKERHDVTRYDLLALDNDTLGRVVELLCHNPTYCSGNGGSLQNAEKKFGPGWVDGGTVRKALEKHTGDKEYAYLESPGK